MDSTVKPSRTPFILKWGALMGVIIYVISYVSREINPDEKSGIGLLTMALTIATVIVCMVLGTKQYRDKALGGYITYGKAYGTSFITGLFATVVTIILTVIVIQFKMEEYKKDLQKKIEQLDKMEEQGADEDAIEMTEKIFDFFASIPGLVIWLAVSSTISSAIWALIAAAIAKKNPPVSTFPG